MDLADGRVRAEVRKIEIAYEALAIRNRGDPALDLEWHATTRSSRSRTGQVDFERGALFLPDSKTGRKRLILGGPALDLLAGLPRLAGYPFVIAGRSLDKPRADIQRPWEAVRRWAALQGVRLYDLRHWGVVMLGWAFTESAGYGFASFLLLGVAAICGFNVWNIGSMTP